MNPPLQPHLPDDWEQDLDRQLRALPEVPAPASLIPRVLAGVAARARLPWWRRTWWTWPVWAQVVSLLVISTVLGALTYAVRQAPGLPGMANLTKSLGGWLAPCEALGNCALALLNGLRLALGQAAQVALLGVALFAIALYLSCLGLGTACYRLADRR